MRRKIALDRQSEFKLQVDGFNYNKWERVFTDHGVAELPIPTFFKVAAGVGGDGFFRSLETRPAGRGGSLTKIIGRYLVNSFPKLQQLDTLSS